MSASTSGAVASGSATDRSCAWCKGPIPQRARRDAETCSKRCRQARHRFTRSVGSAAALGVALGHPRRLAYADPPYPGKAAECYGDHPDYAGEVDHRALIEWLAGEHDAWALSTSAAALPAVLALCPPGVRVGPWVRGFRPNKRAQGPLNAWEPVIYAGSILTRPDVDDDASCGSRATRRGDQVGRVAAAPDDGSAISARRVDALVFHPTPRLTDPARVIGAKPAAFCRWVFEDLLAATPADELVDVFPGSGGVARAWEVYAGKPAILGDRSW